MYNPKKSMDLCIGGGFAGLILGISALINAILNPTTLDKFYIPCFFVGFGMLGLAYVHYMKSPIEIKDNPFSQDDNKEAE